MVRVPFFLGVLNLALCGANAWPAVHGHALNSFLCGTNLISSLWMFTAAAFDA